MVNIARVNKSYLMACGGSGIQIDPEQAKSAFDTFFSSINAKPAKDAKTLIKLTETLTRRCFGLKDSMILEIPDPEYLKLNSTYDLPFAWLLRQLCTILTSNHNQPEKVTAIKKAVYGYAGSRTWTEVAHGSSPSLGCD